MTCGGRLARRARAVERVHRERVAGSRRRPRELDVLLACERPVPVDPHRLRLVGPRRARARVRDAGAERTGGRTDRSGSPGNLRPMARILLAGVPRSGTSWTGQVLGVTPGDALRRRARRLPGRLRVQGDDGVRRERAARARRGRARLPAAVGRGVRRRASAPRAPAPGSPSGPTTGPAPRPAGWPAAGGAVSPWLRAAVRTARAAGRGSGRASRGGEVGAVRARAWSGSRTSSDRGSWCCSAIR